MYYSQGTLTLTELHVNNSRERYTHDNSKRLKIKNTMKVKRDIWSRLEVLEVQLLAALGGCK